MDCAHAASEQDLDGILRRLRPRIESILHHYRIPEQDAEDLVQDVALSLVCREDRPESPEAWMIAGLRYRCLMYWRSRRRCLYRAVDDSLLEILAEPAPASTRRVDIAHDLSKLLPKIPSRCRSILKMRYALGLEPREVAQEMGYEKSSIATITKRCLSTLSQKLLGIGYVRESRA